MNPQQRHVVALLLLPLVVALGACGSQSSAAPATPPPNIPATQVALQRAHTAALAARATETAWAAENASAIKKDNKIASAAQTKATAYATSTAVAIRQAIERAEARTQATRAAVAEATAVVQRRIAARATATAVSVVSTVQAIQQQAEAERAHAVYEAHVQATANADRVAHVQATVQAITMAQAAPPSQAVPAPRSSRAAGGSAGKSTGPYTYEGEMIDVLNSYCRPGTLQVHRAVKEARLLYQTSGWSADFSDSERAIENAMPDLKQCQVHGASYVPPAQLAAPRPMFISGISHYLTGVSLIVDGLEHQDVEEVNQGLRAANSAVHMINAYYHLLVRLLHP